MYYRHLADGLVVFHFCFVVFVILGGLLVLRWRRAAWFHLPALAWGIFVESTGTHCPLTPLEKHWRALAGLETYAGGFVDHYVVPVLYPAKHIGGMNFRLFQCLLAVLIVALNGTVYYLAFRKKRDVGEGETVTKEAVGRSR